ncbi:MAG: N-acetyl-gamma-glutamyl-phosphate reductase [Boseongicola sp.]|nr:N-acetyl-gamma-glutamyl-phosphate reductase [Boseongicola sp.]MDD9977775.1 N-acetyl-gamma-glutamyl-phosphate reductase [Boseongicola sp.]
MPHNIAILGASGYTGAELVRLIATHPSFEIKALSGDRKAGQPMASVYPHLRHMNLPDLCRIEDIDFSDIDMVFCALPHATSQAVIKALPDGKKVVDLSADFRLQDEAAYETWYGKPHSAPDLQKKAVYGLTEFYRSEIAGASLVAGTGCNAATGQFALRPLVGAGVIDLDDIIMDLKAAASGAGRSAKEHLLISELYENVKPYSMGGKHRHLGEFDQELSKVAGRPVTVQLSPHLLPASRGIVVTSYLKGEAEAVHAALQDAYVDEVFIQVLPMGEVPQMKDVRASNFCHIGVVGDRIPGRVTVVAVLDNLTKGSAGQAIQNANLMLGLEETTGLMAAPVYP